jgi:Ca-activated chloride channel family protein
MEITFTDLQYLWFLFAIPVLIIVHFASLRSTKRKALKFANFEAIERITGGRILSKNLSLLTVRLIVVILFVLALAGTTYWYSGPGSNFDFVLAIDSSNSMLTNDFTPNRIEAAKIRAGEFLNMISTNSNVAIVSFAGTSIIEQDLSNEFSKVKNAIESIQARNIGGTDIGEALITSSNLLIHPERPGVIILLTDGQNNVGVPLEDALTYTSKKNIIIYTIGIGTKKGGNYIGNISLKLDEETLKMIAEKTDGKYFKAETDQSLRETYKQIAAITETKIKRELGVPFFVLSLILVLMEWVMINTRYKTIP